MQNTTTIDPIEGYIRLATLPFSIKIITMIVYQEWVLNYYDYNGFRFLEHILEYLY